MGWRLETARDDDILCLVKTRLIVALGLVSVLASLTASAAAPVQSAANEEPGKSLLLYPSHLTWDAQAKVWRGQIHGGVYERERRAAARSAVRAALGGRASRTPDEERIFDARIDPFMYDSEGGKRIIVELGGRSFRSRRSPGSGHLFVDVTFAEGAAGDAVPYRARIDLPGSREVEGTVRLVGPEGIAVISDIDDTVKDSNVLDRDELVANTFFRPYRAVPGMADLYRAWGDQKAAIIFVTASPWQLFQPLWSFLEDSGIPAIAMEMREVRLTGATAVDLLRGPQTYKVRRIREVLKQFPGRALVLAGDSGERDPEVYAAVAREFPERVQGIFIRSLPADRRPPSWRDEVFAGVDESKCIVFTDPAVLPRDLAGWLRSRQAGR